MFKSKKSAVSISIAAEVLESIFDECDRYDVEETGGRLIGYYSQEGDQRSIQVLGVIPPGPNAQRSSTSFFQDGEYQERIFRSIEETHPNVEHLGNWHTHHVNGYPTLSEGDKTTYFKTVNHEKHNTDFFYALLVTRKTPGRRQRYEVRHYIFRLGDERIYEIKGSQVQVIETPAFRVSDPKDAPSSPDPSSELARRSDPNLERAKDQELFSEFYPNLKPLLAKKVGTFYWKGNLLLVDGSHVDVVAIEDARDGESPYLVSAASGSPTVSEVSSAYRDRRFRSARQAVLLLERELNSALYLSKKG